MNTVPALGISASASLRQGQNHVPINDTRLSREERRAQLSLQAGDVFNPFNLFDGAMVPSEILRSPKLLPSEKLVFARLTQFAGMKGKAWPSVERLAQEIALSIPQTRRCVHSLEQQGLIRRLARSGRSNEFEFLWHSIYERPEQEGTPRSPVITRPHSPVIAVPQSPIFDPPQSSTIRPPQSPKIAPGRSPVIARRESFQSSSEEIQKKQHQKLRSSERNQKSRSTLDLIEDDQALERQPRDDPEQEFLLRIQERHGDLLNGNAILQCILGDLKSFCDLKPFLDFEEKLTTAPEKLRNPTGHYRRAVQKFYAMRSKKREWDHREQLRALEAKISAANVDKFIGKPSCPLDRCQGTGEVWDAAGLVQACECSTGQELSPRVLAAFQQMNSRLAQADRLKER